MRSHALAGCAVLGFWIAANPAWAAPRPPQQRPDEIPPHAAAAAQGNSYYYFVAGRHLESEGDIDGAVKAYEQAAALDPRSAEIRAELAALYARQNRAKDAMEWAEAALKLDANNAEANRVLGITFAGFAKLDDESAADNAEALQAARTAVRHLEAARKSVVSPDPALDFTLGRLYLRIGQDDQAIAALRRLSEEDPERGEPTALLAQAYVHAGRNADAIRLLETASATHPEFYASLGELYEDQQRWQEAAGAYERALARNPRNVELRTRLGVVLLSDGGTTQAERAAAVLEEARKLSPTDTQVLYLLAQAQRGAGKLDAAEQTARQLAALAPNGPSAAYALAQVYDEKQQYRRVVDTLLPVVERAKRRAAAMRARWRWFSCSARPTRNSGSSIARSRPSSGRAPSRRTTATSPSTSSASSCRPSSTPRRSIDRSNC